MIGARQAPADSLCLHIVYSNFGGMKREEKVLRGFGLVINLYTSSRRMQADTPDKRGSPCRAACDGIRRSERPEVSRVHTDFTPEVYSESDLSRQIASLKVKL